MLAQDLNIFVNADEFGEMVKLDGQDISAVVNYSTAESSGESPGNFMGKKPKLHAYNLLNYNLTIYFKACDYEGRIPRQSEFVQYEGRRLKVLESIVIEGLVRLKCTTDAMNTPKKPNVFEG